MNDPVSDMVFEILARSKKDLTEILSSLAHEKRLQIIQLLAIDERDFNELREGTGLSKTALVHHLNKMVETGILNHVDRGQYVLSDDGLALIHAIGTTYDKSDRWRNIRALRAAEFIERIHSKTTGDSTDFSDIRIVELPPMRVAYVRVISRTPENDAWAKMRTWAEAKGFFKDLENHPVFGFNNPDPSPGSKEYGYEFWIRVGPDAEAEGDIKIKEFEGGLYAVATCNLKEEIEAEQAGKEGFLSSWRRLQVWVANSKEYKVAKHQWLERATNPPASEDELILDLHMPIRKRGR
jgi:DNA gyrase inhibitor GyrI/DNA-binding transcriptional ArsR family regulator